MIALAVEDKDIVLTIFTPAYNRANLLSRLFESIRNQTFEIDRIEWLVIDDGSIDDTKSTVQRFISEVPGLVRYIRVPNGGKYRTINLAAKEARGEWVMIIDSDDHLAEGAISQVLYAINASNEDKRIGVIRGLKSFPELNAQHQFLIKENPGLHVDWVANQRPFDSSEIIRRTALLIHQFPEFSGEKFMAESWLWHRLDRTHRTFFVNQVWIICYYQENGLSASNNSLRARSPCSAMAVYEEMLGAHLSLRMHSRAAINWWRYRFHANSARKIKSSFIAPRIFAILGWILYKRDSKIRYLK